MIIPVTRQKFYRHAGRLADLAVGSADAPERLVRSVLYLWQRRSFDELVPERAPWGSSPYVALDIVQSFAQWLSEEPFNEAAYWLASAYAIWVGKKTREERALFFTPPALADRVVDHLVAYGACLDTQRWHDPACGGAAFLVPIAQRMACSLAKAGLTPRQRLEAITQRLSGNDLDPVLLSLSRSFLEMALHDLIKATGIRPTFKLFQGDGLCSNVLDDLNPDVIALNPPYRKLTADQVDRYRGLHAEIIEGQPNIYGLFINRALQLPRRGGLIGLLTPTSFLSGRSFSKLRTKLTFLCDVLQVDMLSDRKAMFINVEQETAITILRARARATASTNPPTTRVNVLGETGFSEAGKYSLPNSGRPWAIPRAAEDATLLHLAAAANFRLADYGYQAHVGHLVGYRDKRQRFATKPAGKASSANVFPLVWATDIGPNGKFEHGRASRYHRTDRFVRVRGPDESGVITKPVVLLQRLTSSDQDSRLVASAVPKSFVEEHGGYVCENHVIVLEPVRPDALPPKIMARLLNTRSVDRVFRSVSGASNVAVSELNELLLPSPHIVKCALVAGAPIEASVLAAYQAGRNAPVLPTRSSSFLGMHVAMPLALEEWPA